MNINDMEWIVALAEEQNMTLAASKLFVTQPALSQCLRRVEKELETPIFIRTHSGMELNEAGSAFYSSAKRIIEENKSINLQIARIKMRQRSQIRIGVTPGIICLLSSVVRNALEEWNPDIGLVLCEADSPSLEKMLITGQIDMAITSLPIQSNSISYREYRRDRLVVLLRKNSPLIDKLSGTKGGSGIDVAELKDEPIACTFSGQKSRWVTDAIFHKAGISPKIILETRNTSTLRTFAQQGIATVLVDPSHERETEEREFSISKKYDASIHYVLAYKRNRRSSFPRASSKSCSASSRTTTILIPNKMDGKPHEQRFPIHFLAFSRNC